MGRPNPSRETKSSGPNNGDKETFIFPVQLTGPMADIGINRWTPPWKAGGVL